MKNIFITALLTAMAAISGCSTKIPHDCQLKNKQGYCADMETVYNAAVQDGGDKENVLADGAEASMNSQSNADVLTFNREVSYRAAGDRGTPVYTPSKPHRLWLAPSPYKDYLSGGEYVYYTTPGQWNFGTLTAPGNGAEVLGPLKPEDLGFTPMLDDPNSAQAQNVDEKDGVVQPQMYFGK